MQDRFKFIYLFDNKLYEVVLIDFKLNKIYLKIDDKYPLRTKFDDKKLIQCTGLKDKNDKLIYEGDLVRINNKDIYIVEWLSTYSQFHIEGYGVLDITLSSTYEVVGNIFQDKELMNEA